MNVRKIGFVGGGKMAFAIGAGLIEREVVTANDLMVSGPHLENLTRWVELGADITTNNAEVVRRSDVIFICVKPHKLKTCAEQINSLTQSSELAAFQEKLFVSVLAGIKLETLKKVPLFTNI